jgi:dTDP-4-dehydrorhamnose reductase
MNILLTGAAGQLGSELIGLLSPYGQLVATDRSVPKKATNSWVGMDISDASQLQVLLNRTQPDLIVNAAAYTAVDMAEADAQTAYALNEELPRRLAHWAGNNQARLLHYSTDYVFDGASSVPYAETDLATPQNVYGESKLAGERAIEESSCQHAILRTSWVYSSHGNNFVLSMLDLARKGLSLKVVEDQKGCPTWARNLARTSIQIINEWSKPDSKAQNGVYHYRDDSVLSWYSFAKTVFKLGLEAGLLDHEPDIAPIPSSQFPQPAKRPEWSVLDVKKINDTFGIEPALFSASVQAVVNEVAEKSLRGGVE